MNRKRKINFPYKDSTGNVWSKREDGSLSVSLSFLGDDGLTEQSHSKSCDISYLVESYKRRGLPFVITDDVFKDFTELPDYQTALNTVREIDSLFMRFDAKIREEFGHDPSKLMSAIEDPGQRDRLIELGIFAPKPIEQDLNNSQNVQKTAEGGS